MPNENYTIDIATQDIGPSFNKQINNLGGIALFKATFGQFNLPSVIDYSYLSLVASDLPENSSYGEKTCLGFMALNDSVSCNDADPDIFNDAINAVKLYIPGVQKSNTLFINFWLFDDKLDERIAYNLIREAFVKCPEVDYIVWLCPVGARFTDFMEATFTSFAKIDASLDSEKDPLNGLRVLALFRSKYIQKLTIREARVEDNDDLLPILQKNNPSLMQSDEYFLSDLIDNQDASNRLFVGLHKRDIVGMLAVNLEVNVPLIRKLYDLDVFPNLIQERAETPRPYPLIIGLVGDLRLCEKDKVEAILQDFDSLYVDIESLLPITDLKESIQDPTNTILADNSLINLKVHLAEILAPTISTSKAPLAVVISGFPRTDQETNLMLNGSFIIDHLIELQNVSDEADSQGDDDFIHSHYDALDLFRGEYSVENSPFKWETLAVDSAEDVDPYDLLHSSLRSVIDKRLGEINASKRSNEDMYDANAFAISVFSMDESYSSRSNDMLRVAFEDNPKLDYCLFMLPNDTKPSLLTRHMCLVKLKHGISFDQSLFIMHRSVIYAPEYFTVERYDASKSISCQDFLASFGPLSNDIMISVNQCLTDINIELKENPVDVSFLATMAGQVVGVISLTRRTTSNDDIAWIRANYQVDDWVVYERHRGRSQAVITQFIVSPIYSAWSRFILKEVMRTYGKTLLYYQGERFVSPPPEVCQQMILVAPKPHIQLANPPASSLTAESPLFIITKSIVSQPKLLITNRIVVVGGSAHSISVLSTLLLLSYIHFANLFFVVESPPRPIQNEITLDQVVKTNGALSGCLSIVDADDPTSQEIFALGIQHRTTIIIGRLTDIDRESKAIVVSDDMILEYSTLIIASEAMDTTIKRIPAVAGLHHSFVAQRGIFGLGSRNSDHLALKWAQKRPIDKNKLIVYGTSMEAFNAAACLVKNGIEPYRITIILKDDIESLPDETLNSFLEYSISSSDMTVYKNYTLNDVRLDSNNIVDTGVFTKNSKPRTGLVSFEEVEEEKEEKILQLPCSGLFCCALRLCDTDVFAAVNDSGLIFDGGIVVDENFRTVDENIYALGEHTRFSRLNKGATLHRKVNSKEMGQIVSRVVIRSLGVFKNNAPGKLIEESSSLPKFLVPKSTLAMLTGNLYYYRSFLPENVAEGVSMVTGTSETGRITVVKANHLGVITDITCMSEERIEERNLHKLTGIHESFLNFAQYAFNNRYFDDWISFFRQEWATALYYDKFPTFSKLLRSALVTDKGVFSVMEEVISTAERNMDDSAVTASRRATVGERCQHVPEGTRKLVESNTLEYLRDNRQALSRYYHETKK